TRFAMSNGIGASTSVAAPAATLAVNRWIIGEVVETVAALDKAMADLRFDAAANAIYHFVWDRFCDWYLELIKPSFAEGADADSAAETRAVAGWVLDQILVLLHPFMPFITEELWEALGARETALIVAQWPAPDATVDADAKAAVDWFVDFTGKLRTAKNELGLPPGQRLAGYVGEADAATAPNLGRWAAALTRIARVDMQAGSTAPEGASIAIVVGEGTYIFPLEGVIDIDSEKARLSKAVEAATKEAKSLAGRLNNPAFVEKAKPEAVEKARADHAEKSADAERLAAALARLG
ncbi:MAG: class I tRNA ligase family protein, partial [Sphingobium sp.]